MLRPTVKEVSVMENYNLHLVFDNGEVRCFDVKPYISGNWYCELSDVSYFSSVFANGYTVEWAHGQDICPDELYYNSVKVAN